ncbi:MAG: 30S ribosome-binding factor RbfA [Firmicutes bacterium]|jgi:ribosome-binding factor A|nr:30S ribosome-binding factor RbfA [Bacillota bacterium]NBI62875.1 30S ribosome-binding factor RbfA [Clostridiales bacterium]
MGKGHRPARLGEEIRKIISDLILRELKDPRLAVGMVSVTGVDVTADGSYATVFLTVLGLDQKQEEQEKSKEDVLTAMRSAKGLIRKEIGRQIKLRHVPDLIFKMDTSMEYGRHIEEIIRGLEQ